MEIGKLVQSLGLGELQKEPAEVKGGLLHKMYRVTTSKGEYAVKVLNSEIMKRPTALRNTVNSEKIAATFEGILPVVAAMEVQEKQNRQGGQGFNWLAQYEKAVFDIKKWNRATCDAQQTLAQTLVLSHRDLDPKNVMWNGAKPLVIDWEAAGYINPYQEFLEVLNYWADDGDGGLVRSYFDALTTAYGTYMSLAKVPWDAVFAGSFSGMLGWLDYNVKRALGMEASDEAEIHLGEEQVVGTIGALYAYCDKVELMKKWLGVRND